MKDFLQTISKMNNDDHDYVSVAGKVYTSICIPS